MTKRAEQSAYIASKIKSLRESVDWSQSVLADKAGVTSAAISLIEKGDRLPSLIVIQKLADAFNVSVAELSGNAEVPSVKKDNEIQTFYRRFKDITNLSERDQKIIEDVIKSLKEKKCNE